MSDSDVVEYFSVNESFHSSPKKVGELVRTKIPDTDNPDKIHTKTQTPDYADIKIQTKSDNANADTEEVVAIQPSAESESSNLKRTDDFDDDDFFVIGSISKKKKKSKKHKKPKKGVILEPQDIASTIEQEELVIDEAPPPTREEAPVITKLGSITPPPIIDKSVFETKVSPRKLRNRLKQHAREQESIPSLEDEPEIMEDLVVPKNPDVYEFDDIYEKNRSYIIRVISKLPLKSGEQRDLVLDFSAKGIKKFSRIFDVVLTYFKSTCINDPDFIPQFYTKEYVTFVWLEGKTEIRPFYKPSTLRIPPGIPMSLIKENEQIPTSNITLLLIPEHHAKDYGKIYPEFNKASIDDSTKLSREIEQLEAKAKLDMTDDSLEILEDEKDDLSDSSPTPHPSQQPAEAVSEYFVVGLKGSDNRRIEVQVSPSTQIVKMLHFYMKKKNIDQSQVDMNKVKLIFDDEALDLNGVVGDTELEEDFEVQVVL